MIFLPSGLANKPNGSRVHAQQLRNKTVSFHKPVRLRFLARVAYALVYYLQLLVAPECRPALGAQDGLSLSVSPLYVFPYICEGVAIEVTDTTLEVSLASVTTTDMCVFVHVCTCVYVCTCMCMYARQDTYIKESGCQEAPSRL